MELVHDQFFWNAFGRSVHAFAATPGYMGQPRLGYASAAGVVFGVCIMLLAMLQVFFFRRFRTSDIRIGAGRG